MKIAAAAALALMFTAGQLISGTPNPHVTLEAKATAAMKAGSAREVTLFFHPKKGIHINLDPAIDISAEKNPVTASVGALRATKDAHGYLNAARPVVFTMTAAADAPKGRHTVKLKVVYFLCSDAEGWCNRDEQTLDVPVTVK